MDAFLRLKNNHRTDSGSDKRQGEKLAEHALMNRNGLLTHVAITVVLYAVDTGNSVLRAHFMNVKR